MRLSPLLAACIASGIALVSQPVPALELTPCQLTGSLGHTRADAHCATLTVPENPDRADGPTLDLFVAVIASLSPEPKADAFTIINGGPGGSSVSLYVDLQHAFAGILYERDIVLVDQRGTGRSQPLGCAALQQVNEGLTDAMDPAAIGEATRACLRSLTVDPRFYTTSVAVRDLDRVRTALGYASLTLYGVSYGTRVALHYARRYPATTRALIVDGVVPPELAVGSNVALNAQSTLNRLFERCAREADCAATFAEPAAQFRRLSQRLKEQPIAMSLPHPVTGIPEPLTLTYSHLAIALRLMSYAPETAALIPLVVAEAEARGNYTPLAAQALRLVDQLSDSLMIGMHNAVVCSEDAPYFAAANTHRDALGASYLGTEQLDALIAMCNEWPAGLVDADLKQPLVSAAPTLILSGEEDPITPPAYGEQIASHLSHHLHIVAPGQGHGVIARGCMSRLVTRFVEQGDVAALDTTCVRQLGPSPFFINLMGPTP